MDTPSSAVEREAVQWYRKDSDNSEDELHAKRRIILKGLYFMDQLVHTKEDTVQMKQPNKATDWQSKIGSFNLVTCLKI